MPDFRSLLTFKPAQLSIGKEWFVYYYVTNPTTEKLVRRKIKLNHISSISQRKKHATHVINSINQKLYSGWNPFLEESAPRGFSNLIEVLDLFLRTKKKELRSDSFRTYNSFVEMLKNWLVKSGREKLCVANFNRMDAMRYMDDIDQEKNLSNSTFNNYMRFNRLVFAWLIDHGYCVENHFIDIKKRMTSEKQRILIPENTRNDIKEYLEATDYDFLIVCLLVFHALIRPKEITYLKPEAFSLNNQTIFLSGQFTKNKRDRIITIPNALMPYLAQWNFNAASNSEFIYGENFKPGKTPINARRFSKKWDKLRTQLKLDSKMKLYSLRDSGIVQMLNDGISPEEVMKQADHASLEITTVYTKFANPKGSEQIKKRGTSF